MRLLLRVLTQHLQRVENLPSKNLGVHENKPSENLAQYHCTSRQLQIYSNGNMQIVSSSIDDIAISVLYYL